MSSYLEIASALLAIPAAGFWIWSSLLRIPDTADMTISGEKSPSGYMKKQSKFSAIAAVFAAASAASHAAAMFLH